MTELYHQYRTDIVNEYLLLDKDTLKNPIFYCIGDPDLVPKLFNYSDFDHGETYYFLLKILPKEIWYIIFEMKYIIEKMEYITFYFTPEYKNAEVLHTSLRNKNRITNYYKTNTILGKMHNDLTDVINSSARGETKHVRCYNVMFSFKEFVNRWYLLVQEMVLQFNNDKILRSENRPVDELFFKGDNTRGRNFVKLYHSIRSKIQYFEEEICFLEDIPEERNKILIAKILIYDIGEYVDKFLFDDSFDWIAMGIQGGLGVHNPDRRIWKLDEPIPDGWQSDFYQYYFDFPSWVKTCGIESQVDLVSFMEEYLEKEEEDFYYYNPKWFEKKEDSDDFPLWVMIQEFC